MKPISVGIAGLGRSGWDIHAKAIAELPESYRVVAVMDFDAQRRQEAAQKFDCRTYDNYQSLVSDEQVELVVVATPNRYHTSHAIEALRAGKHVLCEKPFGTNSSDVDAMLEAASENNKIVAPFQNRRYEPLFQKVLEVAHSGVLGEIQLISTRWHGFSRRWDWQTLREFEGGQLLNNAPHALDQALQIWGEHPYTLRSDLRNVLTSGDADDFIKILLSPQEEANGRRGPILDIEMTSCNAFPQDRWLIQGDRGSLRADTKTVQWKWVDWSQLPVHPVERTPTPDRSYNGEKLTWQSDEWTVPAGETPLSHRFYLDFAPALRDGKELAITPQSVQRVMRLIEEVHADTTIQQGQFSLSRQAENA